MDRAWLPTTADSLDRYEERARVGTLEGAPLHRAYDRSLKRDVALWRTPLDAGGSPSPGAAAVIARADALARLSHAGLPAVFDVGRAGDVLYVAFELASGVSLGARLDEGPLPPAAALDLIRQAGAALSALHREGVAHGGVGPEALRIGEDGRLRIATLGAGAGDVYSAPEVLAGGSPTAAADQYALAALAAELLAARGPSPSTTLPSPPPSTTLPRPWRPVVARALSADARARFASVDAFVAALERASQRRRVRPWLVAAAAFVTLLAAARAGQSAVAHVCAERGEAVPPLAPNALPPIAARFAALAGDFGRSAAERTLDALGTYASSLRAARAEACEARYVRRAITGEGLRRRLACLDERAATLGFLVRELSSGEQRSLVVQGPMAARRLPAVESCARAEEDPDPRLDATTRPSDAKRVVHREVLEAQAKRAVGDTVAGSTLAEAALEHARALGDAALLAEAEFAVATSKADRGAFADARSHYEEATKHALAAQAPRLAAEAQLTAVGVRGAYEDHGEEALAALVPVDALVTASGDRFLRASFLKTRATLLSEAGRLAEARAEFEAAVQAYEGARAGPLDLARVHQNFGTTLSRMGDYEAAFEHHRRALSLLTPALGPTHPEVAAAKMNLGNTHLALQAYGQALVLYKEAYEGNLVSLGPDHPATAKCLQNLGVVNEALLHLPEAREHYERALAVFERTLGPSHREVALVHGNLGNVLVEMDLRREADEHYRRAVELYRAGDSDPAGLARVLVNWAELALIDGAHAEARARLAEGKELALRALGREHLMYARYLVEEGWLSLDERQPARAAELFEAALAIGKKKLDAVAPMLAAMQSAHARALLDLGKPWDARREIEAVILPDADEDYGVRGVGLDVRARALSATGAPRAEVLAAAREAIMLLSRGPEENRILARALDRRLGVGSLSGPGKAGRP